MDAPNGQRPDLEAKAACVETVPDLADSLNALRRLKGFTYAGLERAARPYALPRSTISDLLGGVKRPRLETLELFLRACGLSDGDVGPWRAAWERAGQASGPAGAVRVEQTQPRRLGVHASITAPGATGVLPQYVERDIDTAHRGVRALLREAMTQGGMVVLVGGSSVGKTRTAYEAVRALMPQWWLLRPADATQLRAFASNPSQLTVLWLDELQRYLGGEHGLDAATVQTLLQAGAVLVATLWPDRYTAYTTPPLSSEPDRYQAERSVLELAEVVQVDRRLSPPEIERVQEIAQTDARIRLALQSSDYGPFQVIAAGPQLLARWRGANPYQKAVLDAAIDATRLGAETPLSADLLRNAAPGYCDHRQRAVAPPNWFEAALAYSSELVHGVAAALAPVGAEMGQLTGYEVADYLVQHVGAERRTAIVPATAWDAYQTQLADPNDQYHLGVSAEDRLLYVHAEPFYRKAASSGHRDAAKRLANLLKEQGREEELRAHADAGDYQASWQLARLLYEHMREEDLEIRADAGDEHAASRLAALLARRGQEERLRSRADAGDRHAARKLEWLQALLLAEQGSVEELRARADAGDGAAAWNLAELLADQGANDELRIRAEAGDSEAPYWLAYLLHKQGRIEELRARANAGDSDADSRLAALLAEQGLVDELRSRADSRGYIFALRLADLLAAEGEVEELQARAEAGDYFASARLAGTLAEQGRVGDLEARTKAGDYHSARLLPYALEKVGRAEDAQRLRRFGLPGPQNT
ncbi:helix-turn-helix transcriptional regulator [Nonomuraea sp. K274]|uniref:Helix-turn-helix transcriptional regulator n=1 Tax=Nonomuraea cypriaca TaxID=1187855 RepID=A0A931AGM0_9ACTN|nr:helix-turn-helix transcriptional regulator [Nonomuraea cypriaca]MBF8191608.1 helix-turn-helix transcriptional regulator [Nonomuraea cypriaca]